MVLLLVLFFVSLYIYKGRQREAERRTAAEILTREQGEMKAKDQRVRERLAVFSQHLKDYLGCFKKDPSAPLSENGQISGRVITVRVADPFCDPSSFPYPEAGEIDPVVLQLPKEIRANVPEEVGTLVLIHCDTRVVGRYVSEGAAAPGGALAEDCAIRLVDLKQRRTISESRLSANPPETSSDGTGAGFVKDQQIVSYLSGLPRQ
jgi:hypothetical protein